MSKSVELTQEEIDFLISKYDSDLLNIEAEINNLIIKKTSLLKRKSELSPVGEGYEFNAIVAPPVMTKRPIQKDFFGNENLDGYNTLRKRIGYIFAKTHEELSTGEVYTKLVEYFPKEAEKNKANFIQSVSKELGQTPNLYKKNENNRDSNGKGRFTYIG